MPANESRSLSNLSISPRVFCIHYFLGRLQVQTARHPGDIKSLLAIMDSTIFDVSSSAIALVSSTFNITKQQKLFLLQQLSLVS
jgi:hypothetical protein